MKIKKAIIPVAGFGTRFLPITKAIPKAMLNIVDKPAIHYLVQEVVNSGIEEIIIVTGKENREIENYFDRSKELEAHLITTKKDEWLEEIRGISKMANISYVIQEKPIGLGNAIYCARKFIGKGETFAVLLGDDIVYSAKTPCLAQLIKIHAEYESNILGVQHVPDEVVSYYGIVKGKSITERVVQVEDLVEKPDTQKAHSNLAIMGRYIINSDIFKILESTVPGKGGEIQLTDALRILNGRQKLYAYIFEGTRYDVGDKLGYLKATTKFALQKEGIGEEFKKYLIDILDKDVN